MFIQTEETPNPATLKFLPGRGVMESGTANFPTVDSATRSPLAVRLEWHVMKPAILGVIMEHFTANRPVIVETASGAVADGEDSEIVTQIKDLLETRVRPAVAQDGGDIIFQSFEEGVVFLHLQGACSGCPSSTATLKMGIENMLKHYIPEVVEVRAV
jgi:Fe-S cluster biogenesis protein NfuA